VLTGLGSLEAEQRGQPVAGSRCTGGAAGESSVGGNGTDSGLSVVGDDAVDG